MGRAPVDSARLWSAIHLERRAARRSSTRRTSGACSASLNDLSDDGVGELRRRIG